MPFSYDSFDFFFSEEGDYISSDGDIKSTHDNPLRAILQEIESIVKYAVGDWNITGANEKGVAYHIPLGEPNTPQTAEQWDNAILTALTVHGLVDSNDISIESFPVSWDALFTLITLSVQPSEQNGGVTSIELPITVSIQTGEIIYY